MRRLLPLLVLCAGCPEQVPDVTCAFELPTAGAHVPAASGFNLRLTLTGEFTPEQIPLVRFYSEQETANFPEGLLLESGIARPEEGCAVGGCSAGDRIGTADAPLLPGPHTIRGLVLTSRANEACVAEVDITVNSPPVAGSITFDPPSPGTLADVGYAAEATDADGDEVSWTETWAGPNGREVQGPVLPNVETTRGETWTLRLRPRDGMDTGAEVTADVVIVNSAPTAPEAVVWPLEAGVNEPLHCGVADLDSLDADPADVLVPNFTWARDGVDSGLTGALLDPAETEAGEVWTCTATVTDGEAISPADTADATIRDALDHPAALTWSSGAAVRGVRSSMRLGAAGQVGAPGDLDGDGLDEIVIVNNDLALLSPGAAGGMAWVLPGSAPLPTDIDDAAASFEAPPGVLLFAPSRIGDLNADGYDDLVLPASDSGTSSVWIVWGDGDGFTGEGQLDEVATRIVGASTPLGRVSCGLGDLDGDGADELALAAPGQEGGRGALFVVFGHPGAWVDGETIDHLQPSFRVDGAAAGQELGSACGGPVDFDGNGLHDIAVGVPGGGPGGKGRVLVFLSDGTRLSGSVGSAAADLLLDGDATSPGGFGGAMAPLGDWDGDGADDVVIWGAGASGATVSDGAVWILGGGAALPTGTAMAGDLSQRRVGANATIEESVQGLGFCGVPAATDLDGDGLGDLACADLNPEVADELGGPVGVHIWYGAVGGIVPATGPWNGADLDIEADVALDPGATLVGVVDRDGDGYGELLVGAPQDDTGAPDGGAVLLFRLPL